MQIEWKNIKGYEGYYEVSTTGLIKSLARELPCSNGPGTFIKKEKIMKPTAHCRGYLSICLRVNNVISRRLIHRIVAEHFIPNPENKSQINHKNAIKTDNSVENLEWVTPQENSTHSLNMGLMGRGWFEKKVTDMQVHIMRIMYYAGKSKPKDIAAMYQLKTGTVREILRFKQRI